LSCSIRGGLHRRRSDKTRGFTWRLPWRFSASKFSPFFLSSPPRVLEIHILALQTISRSLQKHPLHSVPRASLCSRPLIFYSPTPIFFSQRRLSFFFRDFMARAYFCLFFQRPVDLPPVGWSIGRFLVSHLLVFLWPRNHAALLFSRY